MIWVTDVETKNKVALNPKHIVAVFIAHDGPHVGKTAINLVMGQLVVEESDFDVVASIKAEA